METGFRISLRDIVERHIPLRLWWWWGILAAPLRLWQWTCAYSWSEAVTMVKCRYFVQW